jgi:hypothetical protein
MMVGAALGDGQNERGWTFRSRASSQVVERRRPPKEQAGMRAAILPPRLQPGGVARDVIAVGASRGGHGRLGPRRAQWGTARQS